VERVENREEWDHMLNEPLPDEQQGRRLPAPTEIEVEQEGAMFLALMQQANG